MDIKMIDIIEDRLRNNRDEQWLCKGTMPSTKDANALTALEGEVPSALTHPFTFSWYAMISRFSESARAKFPTYSKDPQ